MSLQVHAFYSFADIVAFLGRDLGQFIADKLTTSKTLRTKDFWVNLPLVITDGIRRSRQVRIQIVDWYGIEYQSLVETCRAYNVDMPSKSSMDAYKTRMDEAYLDPVIRPQMISYALGDLVLAELYDAYLRNYRELCEDRKSVV